jgi:transcriptional regulator with XRE-family HTH domain
VEPSDEQERLWIGMRLLGRRLRDARIASELTLPAAAEGAGITKSHLSDCERGAKLPSMPTLLRIADLYEVLPVQLLDGVYPFGSHVRPAAIPAPPPDGRRRTTADPD